MYISSFAFVGKWLLGIVVCFSLMVREIPRSIPGAALVDICFVLSGLHCCSVSCILFVANCARRDSNPGHKHGGLYDTATLRALSSGIDLCVRCAVFLIVVCAFVGWVWFAVQVVVYSVVCFLRLWLGVACW